MQQVNNNSNSLGILALLDRIQQGVTLPETGKTETSFDQMLNDRVNNSNKQEGPKPQTQDKPTQKPSEEQPAVSQEPQKPQDMEQAQQTALTWAAMSMVQAPVVPVEETVQTAENAGQTLVLDMNAVAAQPVVTVPGTQVTGETQTQTLPLEQAQAQVAGEAVVNQETVSNQQSEVPVQQSQAQPVETTVQTVQGQEKSQMENQAQTGQENTSLDQNVEVKENVAPTSHQIFSDVESIPVKVSDVSAQDSSSETPTVENQVYQGVKEAVQQGDSKLTLQLTPENLGAVTVELTRGADGALRVVLSAERLQTQGLLEKHMSGLQTLLANNSQEPVQIEVQRQQEAQPYNNHSYDGSSGNGKGGYQQQEQNQQQQRQQGNDFLQQLRLGLVPMDVVNV